MADISEPSTPGMRLERLFLHFFDIHFLADKGRVTETQLFRDEMRLATRLAVASANKVYVPAASYFESELCRQILGELDELISLGLIMLCGSSTNLDDFVHERRDENFYRKGSHQHDSYCDAMSDGLMPAYHRRRRSATRDIVTHWDALVSSERLARMLRDAAGKPIHQLESRLESVPAELGGLAFIPDHVYEILDIDERARIERTRIRSMINEGYFTSYVQDLQAGLVTDLSYLASDFSLPTYGPGLSYTRMVRHLQARGQIKTFLRCSQRNLVAFGNDPLWRNALSQSVTRVTARPSSPANSRVFHSSMTYSDSQMKATGSRIILCIAAASVEFDAVRTHFTSVLGNGKIAFLDEARSDVAVRFTDLTSGVIWYLTTLSFQGEMEAANRVERLSNMLESDVILMVGMCMGMPERDLSPGTVVVPNEVFSFDHQRLTKEGTQYRPHGRRVDNLLYRLARMIDCGGLAYKTIVDKGLASASAKIEDPDAALVVLIQDAFPDAAAFDMEGAGFYLAGDNKLCLWIKAVADRGEEQTLTAAGQENKRKTQAEVTLNAADFAIRVVHALVSADAAHQA